MRTLGDFAGQVLALVMLNVIDEKWKDHLYDLDQLRAAIHYRSWGQKDPLIEYKQEAYTMFVDLMSDIHNTFAERFLKVQLQFDPSGQGTLGDGRDRPPARQQPRPTRRYNALGVLEDVPVEATAGNGDGADEVMDIGPDQPPKQEPVARRDPVIVGAGRARSLSDASKPAGSGSGDWSNVGRNDPCPCGSGKKFKKCHGATV
jgi:preprotein translocase subunit SecA